MWVLKACQEIKLSVAMVRWARAAKVTNMFFVVFKYEVYYT